MRNSADKLYGINQPLISEQLFIVLSFLAFPARFGEVPILLFPFYHS